jgi:ABC-type multidrug transport system fused ATPase/permease subunit
MCAFLLLGLLVMICAYSTAVAGVMVSQVFFSKLLLSLLRAPLSLFETTLTGRILNHCSDDITELDLVMPFTLRSMINCVLDLVGKIAVIGYSTPIALAFSLVPAAGYWAIQVQSTLPPPPTVCGYSPVKKKKRNILA